jgi:hypothetical protein
MPAFDCEHRNRHLDAVERISILVEDQGLSDEV